MAGKSKTRYSYRYIDKDNSKCLSNMYMIRRSIAKKVRKLRRARRWTQAELAARLGLSQSRLSELYDMDVLEVHRGDLVMTTSPAMDLEEGDLLLVRAPLATIRRIQEAEGLRIRSEAKVELADLVMGGMLLAEAVVPPGSILENRTLKLSPPSETRTTCRSVLWLNPGSGGILRGSTSCCAVVQVPTHISAGLDMVAMISSSFKIRTSPPSILNREPAYLPKITQSFSAHHLPKGNFSLSHSSNLACIDRHPHLDL